MLAMPWTTRPPTAPTMTTRWGTVDRLRSIVSGLASPETRRGRSKERGPSLPSSSELDVKQEFTERGKKRVLTKRRIAALQVANKASQGNDKTIEMLIRHERAGSPEALQAAAVVAAEAAAAAPLSDGESSILADIRAAALEAARREVRGEGL